MRPVQMAFVLMAGLPASDAALPQGVRAAYEAAEPAGLVRELSLCEGPGGPVYRVKSATGYEDNSVFFDSEGREIGRLIVPDTGPATGDFDASTLTDCEIVRRRDL